jgi:hypothetical protein
MDAPIKNVAFSLPGSANATGQIMHFKDGRLVVVHPGVATGCQPADACPDDD